MSAMDWLLQKAPGFSALTDTERVATMEFSLLWSLFEHRALGDHASASLIETMAKRWLAAGTLNAATFEPTLSYFRERYFQNGAETHHFQHLRLHKADRPDLVRSVLSGASVGVAEDCAVVFIVVYRFRNNLFHGEKWAYEFLACKCSSDEGVGTVGMTLTGHPQDRTRVRADAASPAPSRVPSAAALRTCADGRLPLCLSVCARMPAWAHSARRCALRRWSAEPRVCAMS